jgi:CRP/FNR family cyclic AMP-dependent transcriptional regulator
MSQAQFKAGETIFKAGDPGKALFIVRSGSVDLLVGDRVVETVGPDGVFGEMALIEHSKRSATAVARTDCELKVIEEAEFLFMVRETPFLSLKVMRTLANRLRAMNESAAQG